MPGGHRRLGNGQKTLVYCRKPNRHRGEKNPFEIDTRKRDRGGENTRLRSRRPITKRQKGKNPRVFRRRGKKKRGAWVEPALLKAPGNRKKWRTSNKESRGRKGKDVVGNPKFQKERENSVAVLLNRRRKGTTCAEEKKGRRNSHIYSKLEQKTDALARKRQKTHLDSLRLREYRRRGGTSFEGGGRCLGGVIR